MNAENETGTFIKLIAGNPEDYHGFNVEADELACQLEESGADEQTAFREAVMQKTSENLITVEQRG